MAETTKTTDRYLADFQASAEHAAPSWLRELRAGAIERFGQAGFPGSRDEEWRFTPVSPIAETPFALAKNGADRASALHETFVAPSVSWASATLVFVNGHYSQSLSARLKPGTTSASGAGTPSAANPNVVVQDLKSVLEGRAGVLEPFLSRAAEYIDQPFAALNTAFLHDGAIVWIPANAVLEQPIHLVFLSTYEGAPTVSYPRVLIVADENSQVRIVESYTGLQGQVYFTNGVTDVFVGPAAVVDHYKIQQESDASYHVARIQARLARGSRFSSHSISFGGAIVRNDVVAVMEDEGADCTLNGLYLADGQRLVDNHTTIDHARAHCTSHEIYKGILADKARAVFNGKIVVRPDAQKTDAKQTNKALLLSDDALINSKPQLEIFANDVRCTHGAAVGQLDDDAIFYLRARGISLDEARAMLIHAFASDILTRVRIEPLRAQLEDELTKSLS